jgi:hypothetical protein
MKLYWKCALKRAALHLIGAALVALFIVEVML